MHSMDQKILVFVVITDTQGFGITAAGNDIQINLQEEIQVYSGNENTSSMIN